MKQVFINLPVADPEKSMEFYKQLGFEVNPLFTDEHQKCMVWSEAIYVMLISVQQFEIWNPRSVPKRTYSTANFTLPVETIEKMNQIVENGLEAGGTEPNQLVDEGYMQLRWIEDFDGHVWGIICLDLELFKSRKEIL
jgi:uncharacterized protein